METQMNCEGPSLARAEACLTRTKEQVNHAQTGQPWDLT